MPPRDVPGQLSGTLLLHGDHPVGAEVAPSISVTSSEYLSFNIDRRDFNACNSPQLSEGPAPMVIQKALVP
jgi:hypothetical protein